MYRLLDAESYRDRRILVVGGGDSAAEAAIGLGRQPGNRVTLSYRRDKIVRVKKKNQDALDHAFAAGSIEPLFSSRPVAIEPDRVRLEVEGSGEVELPNDEVFVFAGGVPPFDLLHGMGVAFGGPGRAESE
jgi:thioredoxin reductase